MKLLSMHSYKDFMFYNQRERERIQTPIILMQHHYSCTLQLPLEQTVCLLNMQLSHYGNDEQTWGAWKQPVSHQATLVLKKITCCFPCLQYDICSHLAKIVFKISQTINSSVHHITPCPQSALRMISMIIICQKFFQKLFSRTDFAN